MTRKTTISVTKEVWEELNKRKKLGDSLDDVLKKVLDVSKNQEKR
jgi:predicted CopG family antitoxin